MESLRVKVKGIVKDEDKYLIVRQWYDDRIMDPYRWQFADGEIEFGEDPAKAVVRVVKEKTGIDVVMDRVLYTWSYQVGERFYVGISYECFALNTDTILCEELQDCMWVKKEEFSKYIDNEAILKDLESCDFCDMQKL